MGKRTGVYIIITSAFGTAVVFAATLVFVPVPSSRFHFNLGEAALYTVSLLFGPLAGALAGGLGSFFADLHLGLPVWAPFSLAIKGLEGYLVGMLSLRGRGEVFSMAAGAAFMIVAYAGVTYRVLGWPALVWEIPVDVLQCAVGGLIALFLVRGLCRRFPNLSTVCRGSR